MEQRDGGSEPQRPYETLEAILNELPGNNGEACRRILAFYQDLFLEAPGSSHNHQAWPGGYLDHVTDAMNIFSALYDTLDAARPLPFPKSDGLVVVFLHDLEKPFKYFVDAHGALTDNPDIPNKETRAAKRNEIIAAYGIELTTQQLNAMQYVEGIRDSEYTNQVRLMGELAALCHCADVLSARLWYNYPLPEGDSWQGARRVNPKAASFVLKSEIEN